MDLAVVIPTFNRLTITRQCIDKLRANKNRNDLIIICDSSSVDGTQSIQNFYADLILIDVGPTAWWAAAVNAGVKRAENLGCKQILILNDDVSFSFDLVENIVEASKRHPEAIISASQVVNTKVFMGTFYYGLLKKTQHTYQNLSKNEKSNLVVETTNGSCLLIPLAVFKKIGYFDEVQCPHLYSDTHFQLRALRAGIKTICDLNVRIVQHPNTNYIKRLSLGSMFTAPGSPFKLSAYWAFCNILFGSKLKALFLGVWHHYYFIKQILKALIYKLCGLF